jgi:Cu+-exporting ATPase
MEIDPVCGMEVDTSTAEWTYEYEGTTYYFCAEGCMKDFAEDPTAYLG